MTMTISLPSPSIALIITQDKSKCTSSPTFAEISTMKRPLPTTLDSHNPHKPGWIASITPWKTTYNVIAGEAKTRETQNRGVISDFVKLGRQREWLVSRIVSFQMIHIYQDQGVDIYSSKKNMR